MARIPLVREDDPGTPPEARDFLKRMEGGFGKVFNAARLRPRYHDRLAVMTCAENKR